MKPGGWSKLKEDMFEFSFRTTEKIGVICSLSPTENFLIKTANYSKMVRQNRYFCSLIWHKKNGRKLKKDCATLILHGRRSTYLENQHPQLWLQPELVVKWYYTILDEVGHQFVVGEVLTCCWWEWRLFKP